MPEDPIDLYRQSSDWAIDKIRGASNLDASTPCDEWNVKTLLNHMLETQRYFAKSARGEDAQPPGPKPPSLIGADPAADFEQARTDVIDAFSQPGVAEKNQMQLGIAFGDMLLHGNDIARATGQEDTMPPGLAEAAYGMLHGNFNDDNRKGMFAPEIPVDDNASAQEKLLGYTGRNPSS